MIKSIEKSPSKTKRFRAFLLDGKHIDFGAKDGTTYVDGASDIVRENYLKRHSSNPLERNKINNFTKITPSLLAAHILWGSSRSITENMNELNKRL